MILSERYHFWEKSDAVCSLVGDLEMAVSIQQGGISGRQGRSTTHLEIPGNFEILCESQSLPHTHAEKRGPCMSAFVDGRGRRLGHK